MILGLWAGRIWNRLKFSADILLRRPAAAKAVDGNERGIAAVNRCATQKQKSKAKSLDRRFRGIPRLRLRSGQALAQKTRKDGAPTRVIGVDRSILNEELSAADDGGWALQIDFILPADGLRTSGR